MNRRALLAAVSAMLARRALGDAKAGTRLYNVVCRQLEPYCEAVELGHVARGLGYEPDDLVVIVERRDQVMADSPLDAAVEMFYQRTAHCREKLREVKAPACVRLAWERAGLARDFRRTGPASWRLDNGLFVCDFECVPAAGASEP